MIQQAPLLVERLQGEAGRRVGILHGVALACVTLVGCGGPPVSPGVAAGLRNPVVREVVQAAGRAMPAFRFPSTAQQIQRAGELTSNTAQFGHGPVGDRHPASSRLGIMQASAGAMAAAGGALNVR